MFHLITIARAAALTGLISTGIALSTPAFAADDDAPPQGVIALHGADLTSLRAVAHIERRLRHVALNICSPNAGGGMMNRSEQTCYDTAVRDGLAQIDRRQQQAMRQRAIRLAHAGPDAGPAL